MRFRWPEDTPFRRLLLAVEEDAGALYQGDSGFSCRTALLGRPDGPEGPSYQNLPRSGRISQGDSGFSCRTALLGRPDGPEGPSYQNLPRSGRISQGDSGFSCRTALLGRPDGPEGPSYKNMPRSGRIPVLAGARSTREFGRLDCMSAR